MLVFTILSESEPLFLENQTAMKARVEKDYTTGTGNGLSVTVEFEASSVEGLAALSPGAALSPEAIDFTQSPESEGFVAMSPAELALSSAELFSEAPSSRRMLSYESIYQQSSDIGTFKATLSWGESDDIELSDAIKEGLDAINQEPTVVTPVIRQSIQEERAIIFVI